MLSGCHIMKHEDAIFRPCLSLPALISLARPPSQGSIETRALSKRALWQLGRAAGGGDMERFIRRMALPEAKAKVTSL